MRRARANRFHSATDWAIAQAGLQRYEQDVLGLRHWGGEPTEDPYHNQREQPSIPILGHGMVLWMFRKLTDVSADSWNITEVGSGTQLGLQDEMGGVAKMLTGARVNDYQSYLSKAECMQIGEAGVITFRTKVRIDDPEKCDLFVGFCERGVNLITGRQNSVGFYLVNGSAGLCTETNTGGDAALDTNLVTLVAGEWAELAMGIQLTPKWGRKAVNFFVNNVCVKTGVAKIPTAALAFAFGIRTGTTAAAGLSITTSILLKD